MIVSKWRNRVARSDGQAASRIVPPIGRVLKLLVWSLGLLGSMACASSNVQRAVHDQPVIDDRLIVPGIRIGKVSVGMSTRQLYSVMGAPSKSYSDKNYMS